MAERLFRAVVSVDMMFVVRDGEDPDSIAIKHTEEALRDTPQSELVIEDCYEITAVKDIPLAFVGSLPYNADGYRHVAEYCADYEADGSK